jgi:hypothetical protein
MTIRIKKVGDNLYRADLILPDMPAVRTPWPTEEPMGADQLFRELVSCGAHQVDIEDALADADRNWPEDQRRWP